ncbi:hypothetical protein INT48_005953 [Thamnidium elegans]|uniref:GH18 domain-containing protein n=1 Tax=Thamnidium elegans TaxID=101142 RepID=A0A8H7SPH4_9FUNG|nr:hypothetical protein INT48_005953 [Thamnidium elegans]
MKSVFILAASALIGLSSAYNDKCNDNIVDYWGQNSYGAANGKDTANWQQPLKFYCDDDAIDVLPVSFLTHFFGVGGQPQINLANYCNSIDNATFPDTNLADCSNLAPDIKYCQDKGKLITLSLGGATGGVGFPTEAKAVEFADTLWNQFFGVLILILKVVDPNKLDSHFKSGSKKYHVTAAPQCVYPDANLQETLDGFPFDAVYVQFYNNPCGLQNFNAPSQWNYGTWDIWARTISPNPDVKIFIGAPASATAAGGGYTAPSSLLDIVKKTRDAFPSFGGVMFWDASQARANNRIDKFIKDGLKSGKKCDGSFVFPECKDPAFVAGNSYMVGAKVSYKGYIWTPKWWTSTTPNGSVNSDWSAISSCAGGTLGGGNNSTSTTTKPTTTTTSASASAVTSDPVTTTTSTVTAIPTGDCEATAWSSTSTYNTGMKVVYKNVAYKAAWWSLNDAPGGTSGAWVKTASCPAIEARSVDCNAVRWTSVRAYKTGTKVLYKNNIYVALEANNNRSPETSTIWSRDRYC